MVLKCFLVALGNQHEIPPTFLHDRARRFHLRMERIHQRDGSVQVQTFQQRLGRRDLVALFGHRLDSQCPSAARVDSPHQLSALAATHRFAIQHQHIAILTSQASLLPGPDGLLKR